MRIGVRNGIVLVLAGTALFLLLRPIYGLFIGHMGVTCWGQYQQPIEEALAALEAGGFQVVDDSISSCAGSIQAKNRFLATNVQCCFKVSDCKVQSVHRCVSGLFGSAHIPSCEGSPCNSPMIRPTERDKKQHLDSKNCPPLTSCGAEDLNPEEVGK